MSTYERRRRDTIGLGQDEKRYMQRRCICFTTGFGRGSVVRTFTPALPIVYVLYAVLLCAHCTPCKQIH
ncbi:hypothetical protein EJ03DRAFT_113845 [Teratosphaeria nubilosa]|uniref:Uncharacterized protein n=1 Tax=Teratosphaeria nubilosa TaxID=161662 RepID=A0A6G1L8F9_9PEZI|nr:hypothetical protein EJ03DRAFT_113845 [Teratosphaeria nubilosa]